MIFVTVGNAKQPFARLLDGIEDLITRGILRVEEVCIQRGNNPQRRVKVLCDEPFFTPQEFNALVRESDVVVCHGGAGSLSHVFKCGKVPVVMPRRTIYGEHVDDQLILVTELAALSRIVPAFEPRDLEAAIAAATGRRQASDLAKARMVELVSDAIRELSEHRGR